MENSYSNTYIKDQGGKVVVCCMYNKELITESQKVNIILSYIQQHTFFSQQIRDRTHLQKAHDDSI